MNRSSTRLAIVGGVVLLVAFAIALAQHDARKRARTALNSQGSTPQGAKPIEVDASWERTSETLRVRANNDREPGASEGNPLRSDVSGAMHAVYTGSEAGQDATLAAAQEPPGLPAWLGGTPSSGSLSDNAPTMPQLPQGMNQGLPSTTPGASYPSTQGDGEGLAGLPSLPSNELPSTALPGTELPYSAPQPGMRGEAPASNRRSLDTSSVHAAAQGSLSDASSVNQLPSAGLSGSFPSQAIGTGASSAESPGAQSEPSALVAPTMPSGGSSQALGSYGSGQLPSTNSQYAPEASPRPTASISVTGAPAPANYSLSDTQRPPQVATDLTATSMNARATGTPAPAYPRPGSGANSGYADTAGSVATVAGNMPVPTDSLVNAQQSFGSSQALGGTQSLPSTTQSAYSSPVNPSSSPVNPSANYSQSSIVAGNRPGPKGQLVSNRPGDRYLNGSQNPALIIERRSPDEIQVGKKATFILTVRNAGNATAHNVTVLDSVPKGAKFVGSVPNIAPGQDGMLRWQLGEIVAGDERTITLQLVPQVQGEMGSTASVHFATQASVRTIAVQPKLEILLETNPEVLIQDDQIINVTLRNTGTGVAKGVRLEADIPQQLRHESGDAQLEAVLGDVGPNETKRISLTTLAMAPGVGQCVVRAISVDGVQAEQKADLEVKAPKLAAAIEGPKLRYLERQATFNLAVKNVGTADASDLEFVVHLPTGLKFNAANNRGTYDPNTHTVTWAILGDLPAGRVAPMQLTVMPVDLGTQAIKLSAKGRLGVTADAKAELNVQGLAELSFNISQDNGTIEVGSSSTYSVQIMNIGNKPDKNVQLVVELPQGSQLVDVNAPVEYRVNGQQLVFAVVSEMRNKDPYTYRFQVRHNQAGSQVVRAKVTSANWPTAVVKEEGTLVYNDQQ